MLSSLLAGRIDILMVGKSKTDSLFPANQFSNDGCWTIYVHSWSN